MSGRPLPYGRLVYVQYRSPTCGEVQSVTGLLWLVMVART